MLGARFARDKRAMARTQPFLRSMRLVRGSDFSSAFANGSRARGSILLVVARANGLPGSRLGLSVGRSIWKSAVKRNRVRRIFREAFRLEYRALPQGYDLVLIPARPALDPELAATREELVHLANKAAMRAASGSKPPERKPREKRATPPSEGRASRAERAGGTDRA